VKTAIGYIRVSTDKQDGAAQRAAICEAAALEGLKVRLFEEEVVSSRATDRKVFDLVRSLQAGETVIVYELSRLGRSIGEVFEIVQEIRRRGAALWVLKPEVRTGEGKDLLADALIFALGVGAQIERDLISERTKAALRARKLAGVKLGRPKGRGKKVEKTIADKGLSAEFLLQSYKTKAITATGIARLLGLDQRTVLAWIREKGYLKERGYR